MKEREEFRLLQQPARKQALIAVRQFENETRLACTPKRRIRPIVTALPRVMAHRLAFSPDGKWLMVSCSLKVFLLAVQTRTCVQVLVPPNAYINTAALSPDGSYIATGEPRGLVTLWDSHTGENLWQSKGHDGGGIKKLAFTSDNSKVVSITLSKHSEIGIWDLQTGQLQQMVRAGVRDFVISPDGKTAIISEGLFISVLDLESGRILREFHCDLPIQALALSSDGHTVVGLDDKRNEKFLILDLSSGHSRWVDTGIHHEFFALHPGGEMLVATESDYDNRYYARTKTCFWDLRTGSRMEGFENGLGFPAAFSPDGNLLAAMNGDALVFGELLGDSSVGVWRRDPVWQYQRKPVLSLNGRWLVTEGTDNGINLWDLQTGHVQPALVGKLPKADRVAISHDGDTVAATGWKTPVEVWNAASERLLHSWQPENPSFIQPLAFHPNGRVIAYADEGKVISREVGTGEVLQVLDTDGYVSRSLVFSADSRSLVSEGYGYIYWWDVDWGRCMLRPKQLRDYCEFDDHKLGKITVQLVNPADLTCLVAEWHTEGKNHEFVHQVHLLDLKSGRYLQHFKEHTSEISCLSADPMWTSFVSVDKDGRLCKWDLGTGTCVAQFMELPKLGYGDEITFLQVSPDGKRLIACNLGGILNFWDYQSGEFLATAYNLSDGYLWTTPTDEFAPNGWLHTDRPDLVSLLETDKADGEKPEYILQGDKRFDDYLRIYNDGEMVMTRLNDWNRYQQLLQIRLGNQTAMDDHLLSTGAMEQLFLPMPGGVDDKNASN